MLSVSASFAIEPRIDVTERLERPNHQSGGDQQHKRECNLNYHQHAARAMPLPALARGASAAAQRAGDSRTGILDRGNHPEQKPRHQRGRECEQDHRGIDGNFIQPRQMRRSHSDQYSNRAIGER